MADEQAFPAALRSSFGPDSLRRAACPGKSESERTAKKRLDEWATGLLGEALLDRGSAYAYQTGTETRPGNVGESRNPDLHVLLRDELPNFLEACAVRRSAC